MIHAAVTVTIDHPTGLHARPAVKLTRLAKSFPAAIRLRRAPDGEWVDAKSIVKVMGLKIRTGTAVDIEAEGEAARAALAAIEDLIRRGFDEVPHG